jgi:hypothetical protein
MARDHRDDGCADPAAALGLLVLATVVAPIGGPGCAFVLAVPGLLALNPLARRLGVAGGCSSPIAALALGATLAIRRRSRR